MTNDVRDAVRSGSMTYVDAFARSNVMDVMAFDDEFDALRRA